MGKIYMIGSQKGGTAKTTTTFNLAYCLRKMGKRVLAVDFDSQANLTTCFGVEDTGVLEDTIGHLMMVRIEDEKMPSPKRYIRTKDGVDFIPSSIYLSVVDALQVGTDSEGGYLVPDEFEHTLVEALEEENFFRGIATVIQTSSGDRKIPVVATKGTASWIDEEGAYPESDDSFGQVSIGAYKVATMLKVSDELLNDSVFDLEAYISKEFGRRIGTKEEEAFFTGDGKGKPTGIFNAVGGASDGVTTAAAGISFDDVMDLFYALKSPYRRKAVWVLNDTTVKALRKLKDNNGNYIWQPSVQAGQPDMILNRPYYTSAYVPEVAAGAKVMAFGDFSYYWIADRQGRSFKRLNELFAANGQVGFLASQRVDGKLILSEAVKTMAIKGSSAGA